VAERLRTGPIAIAPDFAMNEAKSCLAASITFLRVRLTHSLRRRTRGHVEPAVSLIVWMSTARIEFGLSSYIQGGKPILTLFAENVLARG
jgi:hypothetical protein